MTPKKNTPLVYSCSGYSSAAQMANHLALSLDRAKQAEMSCIAGVGGKVKALVRVAHSGRPIVALDGCPLACARTCLENVGASPDVHHVLSEYGVKKRRREFDEEEAAEVLGIVLKSLESLRIREDEPTP